jgi:hypothetical protein
LPPPAACPIRWSTSASTHSSDPFPRLIGRLAAWPPGSLATFIRSVAAAVQAPACEALLRYHSQWFSSWIVEGETAVRRAGVALAYALFLEFPRLATPLPARVDGDRQLIATFAGLLIDRGGCVVELSKRICTTKEWPTDTCFELLGWVVSHSELQLDVWRAKLATICDGLSKIGKGFDEKRGLLDAISFLAGLPACFDATAFTTVIGAIDRFPSDPIDWKNLPYTITAPDPARRNYLQAIDRNFLNFLTPYAALFGAVILKSDAVRALLPTWTHDGSSAFCRFAGDLANQDECRKTICQAVFQSSVFTSHFQARDQPYLALVWNLLRGTHAGALFAENCAKCVVASILQQKVSSDRVATDLMILQRWSSYHTPKSVAQFWLAEKTFIEGLFRQLTAPEISVAFARTIIEFLRVILNYGQCAALGLRLLRDTPDDFFVRLHRECRPIFTALTIAVDCQAQPPELALRDLRRLFKLELFDASLIGPCCEMLESSDLQQHAHELTPFFGRFFTHAADLDCFHCEPLALQLARQANLEESAGTWSTLCLDLVFRLCAGLAPDIGEKEAAAARAKLEIAANFFAVAETELPDDHSLLALAGSLAGSPKAALAELGRTLTGLLTLRPIARGLGRGEVGGTSGAAPET